MKLLGPCTAVSLQTTNCIDNSGVIQGPPLPHQPPSLFMFTVMPSRVASFTACWIISLHWGLKKRAAPFGTYWSTSI